MYHLFCCFCGGDCSLWQSQGVGNLASPSLFSMSCWSIRERVLDFPFFLPKMDSTASSKLSLLAQFHGPRPLSKKVHSHLKPPYLSMGKINPLAKVYCLVPAGMEMKTKKILHLHPIEGHCYIPVFPSYPCYQHLPVVRDGMEPEMVFKIPSNTTHSGVP